MKKNLILDQIEIINGEEQIFDIYDMEGGAYLTASFWQQSINILATFSTQGVEGAEWRLQSAYFVKDKKIKPIKTKLTLSFIKQPNTSDSWNTHIKGTAIIENRQLKIDAENFATKKYSVDYKKPWSLWDRWKLRRALQKILDLPGITVPIFG